MFKPITFQGFPVQSPVERPHSFQGCDAEPPPGMFHPHMHGPRRPPRSFSYRSFVPVSPTVSVPSVSASAPLLPRRKRQYKPWL